MFGLNIEKIRILLLLLSLLFVLGCGAHRSSLRSGDQAMERGSYIEAVQHYRQALELKPNSDSAREKYLQAEELVLRQGMDRAEIELERGEVLSALEIARDTLAYVRTPARVARFKEQVTPSVSRQIEDYLASGDYSEGLWYLEVYFQSFGASSGMEDLRERIFVTWIGELRREAEEDRRAQRYGAAAARHAVAGWLEENRAVDEEALQDYQEVRQTLGWRVDLSGNEGSGVLNSINRNMESSLSPIPVGPLSGRTEGAMATVHFILGAPAYESWEERTQRSQEYQSGTRLVENPEYAEAYRQWEQSDLRLREAERRLDQAWREVRDAERELENRRRRGASTSVAENRVDRAYRDVRSRERALDSRVSETERLFVAKRRLPTQVEEPVFNEHFYEVARQRGRKTALLRVQLTIPEASYEEVLETRIIGSVTTERYSPQPVLGLRGRSEPPPTREDVRLALAVELEKEVLGFLKESFTDFRRRLVGSNDRLDRNGRIDVLATYLILDPSDRDSALEEELNELVGFDDTAALLVGLAREN